MIKPPSLTSESSSNPFKSLLEAELAEESSALPVEQNTTAPEEDAEQQWIEVEGATRFSKSQIWALQRTFFQEQGIEAWRQGTVPHYVTSSSYMAYSYAEMVLAWVADQQEEGRQNLRVLELGGGSGQFTFHFLKHATELWSIQSPSTTALPFTYVLSDLAEANLIFWAEHLRFQDWISAGVLDLALFDAENDSEITLRHSGAVWGPAESGSPLLVIGNYFFDGISQDYWLIDNGKLGVVEVGLTQPEGSTLSLSNLEYTFQTKALEKGDYAEEELNALLEFYRQHIPYGYLNLSQAGYALLQSLQSWCNHNLTLISCDKGRIDWREFVNRPMHEPVEHGSISTTVNYHAFNWLVEQSGGKQWWYNVTNSDMELGVFSWDSLPLKQLGKHCTAFSKGFGPVDQFTLKKSIERGLMELSFSEIMAYLRFSKLDPKAFRRSIPRLMVLNQQLSAEEVASLETLVQRVWGNYYPMGEQPDLAFGIGCLFYELDLFAPALWFFERSVELYGEDEGTMKNIANCKQMQKESAETSE